jgi:hypothetical protein
MPQLLPRVLRDGLLAAVTQKSQKLIVHLPSPWFDSDLPQSLSFINSCVCNEEASEGM